MRSTERFLKNSFEEHGMTADAIVHEQDSFIDRYYVIKNIGGEKHYYKFQVTAELQNADDTDNTLGLFADQAVEYFRDVMTDTFEYNNRRVTVCPYEGGWAECRRCGASVELSDYYSPVFSSDAETSLANPNPRDVEHFTEKIGDGQRLTLEFYLLGLLRLRCDSQCPNNRKI